MTTSVMTERPIIFSGEMVKALLAGTKTQTRRLMKPQPTEFFSPSAVEMYSPAVTDKEGYEEAGPEIFGCYDRNGENEGYKFPYGVAGDRLWVREKLHEAAGGEWLYSCDGTTTEMSEADPRAPQMLSWAHHIDRDYCPSIHMPRWASRITLEITKVRVERLQDISEEEAEAEGVSIMAPRFNERYLSYRQAYMHLWDSLHGKGAWDKNPWVWILEFKRTNE